MLTGNLMEGSRRCQRRGHQDAAHPGLLAARRAPDPVVAPTVGADTEVVLKECGYTDEEIKKMAEEKVVGLGDTWDRSMYVIKF